VRLEFLLKVLHECKGQELKGFSVVSRLNSGFTIELIFPWM